MGVETGVVCVEMTGNVDGVCFFLRLVILEEVWDNDLVIGGGVMIFAMVEKTKQRIRGPAPPLALVFNPLIFEIFS